MLRLHLPRAAEITFRRDGAVIHTESSAELGVEISQPGAYRVEARIDRRLWLLSNPIHLRRPAAPS